MPDEFPHIQNSSSELETGEGHLNLQRLRSLQKLMSHGETVLSDVTQFVIRAREEAELLQREHRRLIAEEQKREELRQTSQEQLETARQSLQEALKANALAIAETELLKSQLAECRRKEETDEGETVASRKASAEVRERLAQLERDGRELRASEQRLQEEKEARNRELDALKKSFDEEKKCRRELAAQLASAQAGLAAAETARTDALSTRLAFLEEQLKAERERRSHLMEVIRAQQIRVEPQAPKVLA